MQMKLAILLTNETQNVDKLKAPLSYLMDEYALEKGRLCSCWTKYCYWEPRKSWTKYAEVLQLKLLQSNYK